MAALYEREGDSFLPSRYTAGPWSAEFQHAGPPTALLARAIERAGTPGLCFARITADILRPVPIAPLAVQTRVLRPGRRVEQAEATLRLAADGSELMRVTAWRVAADPLELEGADPQAPPTTPDGSRPITLPWWEQDQIAYHAALEWRLVAGSVEHPGPAFVWARLLLPLVEGEDPTAVERLLVMGDAASGVSWALDWSAYTFPNLDFSVHLERPPDGEWFAMDAVTRPGPRSFGQTSAVLHDLRGRVGLSTQTLVLAAR